MVGWTDTSISVYSKTQTAPSDRSGRDAAMMNRIMITTAGLSLVHRSLQLLTWMEGFICRLQPSIPEPLDCLTSISLLQPPLICPPADYACSLKGARAGSRGSWRTGQLSAQCVHIATTPPDFPFTSRSLHPPECPHTVISVPASCMPNHSEHSCCCCSFCRCLSN